MVSEAFTFFGMAAVVIVTPGQDTALAVSATLAGGRAAGLRTAIGLAKVHCGDERVLQA